MIDFEQVNAHQISMIPEIFLIASPNLFLIKFCFRSNFCEIINENKEKDMSGYLFNLKFRV